MPGRRWHLRVTLTSTIPRYSKVSLILEQLFSSFAVAAVMIRFEQLSTVYRLLGFHIKRSQSMASNLSQGRWKAPGDGKSTCMSWTVRPVHWTPFVREL